MLHQTVQDAIREKGKDLSSALDADIASYYGPIHPSVLKQFRNFIEQLGKEDGKKKTLAMLITTPGGIVETVEQMVNIMRYHYSQVFFVVPDSAMSAGTILCMSGDKIFMDYSSALGPIDPQVLINDRGNENYVPALGYLDMVERLIQKSKDGTMTPAEFALLQSQDLALLRRYEQAKDLSIELLKKWLVAYKFKSWTTHRSTPSKLGTEVTHEEREQRAEEIARKLGDNKTWHSHSRMIGIERLKKELRLEIDDYSENEALRPRIRAYHDLLMDHVLKEQQYFKLHSPN